MNDCMSWYVMLCQVLASMKNDMDTRLSTDIQKHAVDMRGYIAVVTGNMMLCDVPYTDVL